MLQEIKTKGIVLSAAPYGEYDKRLVILSETEGRITVFANGIRKQNSRLSAAGQSFVMGEFTLRQGRDTYTLVGAEIKESFIEMSYDMEKMCYASYFCEFTSYYTREGLAAADELNLLYLSFKALLSDSISDKTVKLAFELKLMDIEGEVPEVSGFGRLDKDTEYVIRYILSAPLSKLYSFNLDDDLADRLGSINQKLIGKLVDKEFKSLKILEGL